MYPDARAIGVPDRVEAHPRPRTDLNRSEFVVARKLGLSITAHCTKRLNPTTLGSLGMVQAAREVPSGVTPVK